MSEVITAMNSVYPARFHTTTTSFRAPWLIPGIVFLGIFIPGILLIHWPKSYSATSSIEILMPSAAGLSDWGISPADLGSRDFLKSQAELISSNDFITAFSKKTELAKGWNLNERKAVRLLQGSTNASVRPDSRIIDISYASTSSREEAVKVANDLGNAFTEHWRNTFGDQEMIDLIKKDKDLMDASAKVKAEGFALLESSGADEGKLIAAMSDWEKTKERSVKISKRLEQAYLQSEALQLAARVTQNASLDKTVISSEFPIELVYLLSIALVSTGLTSGLVRIKSRKGSSVSEINQALAPPTLTLLPIGIRDFADHPEPFRKMRVAILESNPDPRGVLIVSTSFLADEDASGVTSELAKTLAIGGNSTLLIDGNIHDPRVHDIFNAAPQPGLKEFLVEDMQMHETVVKSKIANLWVMPGGSCTENPTDFPGGERMVKLLHDAKRRFDFVVINSPSLLSSTESLSLIGESDMAFLTTEAGRSRQDVLVKARAAIEQAGGNLSGLVLTQVTKKEAGQRASD